MFSQNKQQGEKGESEGRRFAPAAFIHLCPLAADPASELDVLGHDGNALGVDGAQVRVLEQADLSKFSRQA